jgi:hypothetical protein
MSELIKRTATPESLISQAINKGVDIAQLEKLMELQERWEAKESRKAFFTAMANFQSEKPTIKRTSGVSHDNGKTHKYFFAKLPYIQSIVDPILSKFGLSYSFKQETTDNKIKITCIVRHVDGHSEETHLEAAKDNSGGKSDIQALGSAISYLMRYTFKNAFALSEGDDDGVTATLTRDELNQMALEKLITLREAKADKVDDKTLERLDQIVNNKEEGSYAKAIKTLEKL